MSDVRNGIWHDDGGRWYDCHHANCGKCPYDQNDPTWAVQCDCPCHSKRQPPSHGGEAGRIADLENFVRFVSRNKGSHTALATELMQRLNIGREG